MYELVHAAGNSYYVESPAKIGLVVIEDGKVVLIDSGGDKESGRKVRQILERNSWHLEAIYNTHSNADHIGGNSYLQKQTGCRIYAKGAECAFTRHTVLEPSFLYGGYPFQDLRHKFLMAQDSSAEYMTESTLPSSMKMIDLPRHFVNMVGFSTGDGVVYLADCLSSKETLDKYGLVFIYDVASYLKTLDMVMNMEADLFVPAHAAATEHIAELASYNASKVYESADAILSICSEPQNTDSVIESIFSHYNLKMSAEQYVLVGSTVRSYLSWLKDKGELAIDISGSKLLWRKA